MIFERRSADATPDIDTPVLAPGRIEALIMANNSIQEALDRMDPELKARAEAARDNCTCAPCEAARYFHEELERLAGRSKMIKRTRQYDLGLTSACRLSLI
jgi:hypothetical protein